MATTPSDNGKINSFLKQAVSEKIISSSQFESLLALSKRVWSLDCCCRCVWFWPNMKNINRIINKNNQQWIYRLSRFLNWLFLQDCLFLLIEKHSKLNSRHRRVSTKGINPKWKRKYYHNFNIRNKWRNLVHQLYLLEVYRLMILGSTIKILFRGLYMRGRVKYRKRLVRKVVRVSVVLNRLWKYRDYNWKSS